MYSKIMSVIALVSILANITFAYLFIYSGKTVESNDHRIAIVLDKQEQETVLSQMRTFLRSIQAILVALETDDEDQVIAAATMSGISMSKITPVSLKGKLPRAYKKISNNTQKNFDALANSTTNEFDRDSIVADIATIMDSCINCHDAFKIISFDQEF